MPPLVARPRVIPLRSSTPVTALGSPIPSHVFGRHTDGLGLVRGSLAHRAIEIWFTNQSRPSLVEVAQTLDSELGAPETERIAEDVDAMLDLLDASPLAATLRDPSTRAYFELPFSWDWEGVPVHGTVDLAYESGGIWNVIDFETDEVQGKSLNDVAEPYLPQLALYASALEEAIGQRPETGLLLLRTGDVYVPAPHDLDNALATTRARIDAGQVLETPASARGDDLSSGPDVV